MKRTIQILVVAFVLIGYSGFASGSEPFVKASGRGSKEFFLFMNKVDINNDNATISLKGESGEVIYKEKLQRGTEYRKLFDVNALPEGSYVLEIEDENRVKTWSLSITQDGLQVNNSKEDYFKPTVVQLAENKLGVSLLNSNLTTAKLSIYDNNNNEVFFTETLGKDLIIQRLYDLSLLRTGSYTISVQVNGKTFNENIDL